MKVILFASLLVVAGCARITVSSSPAIAAAETEPLSDAWAGRVEVIASRADRALAQSKARTAVEGEGWVFDPPFATARNEQGDDLAVCGHGNQPVSGDAVFFAFYQGELLLWDERAPAGISVENQFITLICGTTPPVKQAA